MAITRTNKNTRPNTSVPWLREAGKNGQIPGFMEVWNYLDSLPPEKYHFEGGELDNGLTSIRTYTFDSLETLGEVETLTHNIALQYETFKHRTANEYVGEDFRDPAQRTNAITYAGINQPFRLINTYTFAPEDVYRLVFAGSLESYEHYGKKEDIVVTDVAVIVTHRYEDAADLTLHPYLDMFYIPQLAEKGVTRTIKYELV